jgi:hypothetical protein
MPKTVLMTHRAQEVYPNLEERIDLLEKLYFYVTENTIDVKHNCCKISSA